MKPFAHYILQGLFIAFGMAFVLFVLWCFGLVEIETPIVSTPIADMTVTR